MEEKDFLTVKVFEVNTKKLLMNFKFNQDIQDEIEEGQTFSAILTENKDAPILTQANINIVWVSEISNNEQFALAEIEENSKKQIVNEDFFKKLNNIKDNIEKIKEETIKICPRAAQSLNDALQNVEYTIKYYEEYKNRM